MIEFDEYKVRLNARKGDLESLGNALDLTGALRERAQLEEESMAEGFWNDLADSQRNQKRRKQLENKCAAFDRLKGQWEDLYTLCDMALEAGDDSLLAEVKSGLDAFEKALDSARLATLLSGPYDDSAALLTLHAGAGGTEAQDWAEMLFRMYVHWGEQRGYTVSTLDYLDGDEAGLKSAMLRIEGENAFGYLKSEMGVHRLVRISPFDASGRRHTSFAAVEVMPEISDDVDIEIRDEDLKVDTYRSGGAGGQHVNKTESAIRITHVPTGVVVACQNERSQVQNRAMAMRMLRSKLVEIKEREHLEQVSDIKGDQKAIEWGSQIRSYVFMPYTLVKDHRTGCESGNIQAVMDGGLDAFIDAYLRASATGEWAR
ncbi:MAG: peptide chain release factor 2 [Oscillospiraceae bacterium]|jgi:peptide chain release factor 2|nr:peptide chain release factor 2 [Oscillospiraceae bacterium]